MLISRHAVGRGLFVVLICLAVVPQFAWAQVRETNRLAIDESSRLAAPRGAMRVEPGEHPLAAVLDYARREKAFLDSAVHDFTCRLVKRERIEGFLQEYTYVDLRVREEVRRGDVVEKPLAIFLHFVGPAKVAGRRVLYVQGENDDKMLVRNGGRHFDYVLVRIDPNGESARDESLVPITESGFKNVLKQMIGILEQHRKIDADGSNTRVEQLAGAKINKRPCTLTRVEHPREQAGLHFHIANVFVDDELRVPVRIEFNLWPKREGQKPPLLAEYTYTDLKLNVGLSDSVFRQSQLRGD